MMIAKTDMFPGSGYYRSTVEAAGQFEGYASSGLMGTGRTGLDDSDALRRKSLHSGPRNEDTFGVPRQIISLSRLSIPERRELLHSLRSELEQVRRFRKKFELQKMNAADDDILSFSNGTNGHQVGTSTVSMSSGPGKKAGNFDTGRWNRTNSSKFESSRQTNVLNHADLMLMKQCKTLLERLMAQKFGWVFNSPVDVVKLNIPDYLDIIKHPMDLGTIKSKINSGAYSSPLEFVADVRLTFQNAMLYNPKGHDVHTMAQFMSDYFERRWKTIEKKIQKPDASATSGKLGLHEEFEATEVSAPKKRKISSFERETRPQPAEMVMTAEEKNKLGIDLQSVIGELPANILDFLKKHCSSGGDDGDDEIEIDMDALGNETLYMLRKLLDDFMLEREKIPSRDEPCEIEMLNESAPSNSSMQHHKGDDQADEDVDIGGNEPPVSSYPPVEIEKDMDQKSKIPNSPGRSSVSDSHHSDRKSDGLKSTSPRNESEVLKNECGVQSEEKTAACRLDQPEPDSQPQPSSVESDNCQDGESGPGERQVSPEKLIRYALLKNRYSDIILKAQEKTLSQVGTLSQDDKGDPEKLQREREELEQRRKREKARLQAEAKAAEDARRRAEAAAAAEAKRKRELEREAARQALLQMEKTVEINENSRILEDLEMLRTAPPEQLPSSVDETSPDISQDGFGGFRFGGSNPLEQLGLYMKEDEEDEEGEPQTVVNPNLENDVEEGEID